MTPPDPPEDRAPATLNASNQYQVVPNSVEINLVVTQASSTTPLQNAWVYVLDGSSIHLLRTNQDGRVKSLAPGGDRTMPQDYTQTYTTTVGMTLNLYFSRGAKPIPDSILSGRSTIFWSRTVPAGTGGVSQIILPNILMSITRPDELSIWPLLWELPDDTYLTLGINQGRALWTSVIGSGDLTVRENGPAHVPGPNRPAVGTDQVRPQERGLNVAGTIDARATGVRLQILDTSGALIQLKQSSTATTGVTEITVTPGTASGNTKPFEAAIYFMNSATAFGPIQILILSDGTTPQIIGAFTCYLAGLQLALVDDHDANLNGQIRGPIKTEQDERMIVDFLDSPQLNRPAISDQTRARRMIAYQMAIHDRALSSANNTLVPKPQMPLWMAELQILGMSQAQLENLMSRRQQFLSNNPTNLQFELQQILTLSWDGPDSGTMSPRQYVYSEDFTVTQTVTINLTGGHIANVNPQGVVANAFTPAPTAMTFPVNNRRLPQCIVSGQTRIWGRQNTGTTLDTTIIEWQPRIESGGNEAMRGGDGLLKVESITIAGQRINGGLIPSNAGTSPPPPGDPDLQLPRFRVRGLDPPGPANAFIDNLVEDYYNAHNTANRVTLLTLACWQETIRRIIHHESEGDHQFEFRGAGRRSYKEKYYGHEQDMPIFGAPHGYGYGQLDNPSVTHRIGGDGAWSFFANIRESIHRIMGDKATDAYNHIRAHIPAPVNQTIRAVYQREIVRRYNSGREFQWNNSDWEINPTLTQTVTQRGVSVLNPRLAYPNNVLGTNINYAPAWPIPFTAHDYGPETR